MPSDRHHLLRSSFVVGSFSLLGSLTGILVETSIAAQLGLSKSSDSFYVAFTVPYIICNLLSATGQFSLVPFFTTLETRHSDDEFWRGFSYAVNVIFLGLGGLAAAGAAAAPWLIRGVAPGLTRPQIDLAAQLCQWLFLMIVPAGVAETFRSFLLSQRRFALASAAGFIRNSTVVLLILFTFQRYGAYSIVLGYLAGYFLQVAVLGVQILVSFRVRYSLALVGSGEAFQNLRGAGAAQLITALSWQAVVIVERIIASFLPPGTLTALNYGFKILGTLSELLAGSVGTAALAVISREVALRAEDTARKTFQSMLAITVVMISPIMVFCLLLPRNIIRLVFERGNFTPEATVLMSVVFFYYSLSLGFFAIFRVLTFYLFARHETGWFIRLSLLHYGLAVALDLLYVGALRLGPRGIPLALLSSLAITAGLAFKRNLAGLKEVLDRSVGIFALKDLLGSILAAFAVCLLRFWVTPSATKSGNFLYICELCGAGSVVFFGMLAATRALPISDWLRAWRSPQDT